MVSLRNGKALQPQNSQSKVKVNAGTDAKAEPTKEQQEEAQKSASNSSKKRKATEQEVETEIEPEDESDKRPSTPPPAAGLPSELADEPNYEKTPGRDGPIKKEDFTVNPDIKPFKGPKGKKVRKTYEEKEEENTQFALDNENYIFHEYVL